jgi:ketosteroid isomerase-like protein
MSQENVEIVRRIYDAVARRDDVTPFEVYAEDIVWEIDQRAAGLMPKRVYQGHEGVRQFWRDAAWSPASTNSSTSKSISPKIETGTPSEPTAP